MDSESFPRLRRSDPLVLLWGSLGLGLGVCALFNSRFWWQDVLASLAPLWLPFVVLGLVVSLYRMAIGKTPLITSVVVLTVLGYISGRLGRELVRYYETPTASRVATTLFVPLSLGYLHLPQDPEAKLPQINPDLLVLSGTASAIDKAAFGGEPYPFSSRAVVDDAAVEIRSRFPFEGSPRTDFGIGALPAVFATVVLPDAEPIRVGGLYLELPFSRQGFERSKTTARRLATVIKNGRGHAIVTGTFFATSFSKTSSMFRHHIGLQSALWGTGFSPTWRWDNSPLALPLSDIYLSYALGVEKAERLAWLGDERPLLAHIRVPRTESEREETSEVQ